MFLMLQVPITESFMMATTETTPPEMDIQTTQVIASYLSTKEKYTNGKQDALFICILTAKFIEM